jgi:hypothetical protein
MCELCGEAEVPGVGVSEEQDAQAFQDLLNILFAAPTDYFSEENIKPEFTLQGEHAEFGPWTVSVAIESGDGVVGTTYPVGTSWYFQAYEGDELIGSAHRGNPMPVTHEEAAKVGAAYFFDYQA